MSASWVGAAGVAVLVAVWWILAATAFRSSGAVPTPPAVLHQFAEDGWDFYWTNASVTLRGAAVGYLWGNLLALAVALVVLLLPVTEGVATQLAVISHCMPLTAIGPIILVVFGGRAPTIFRVVGVLHHSRRSPARPAGGGQGEPGRGDGLRG
jgi:ABC-type nitrate/sulfonate/bicarbonate transport system permease component